MDWSYMGEEEGGHRVSIGGVEVVVDPVTGAFRAAGPPALPQDPGLGGSGGDLQGVDPGVAAMPPALEPPPGLSLGPPPEDVTGDPPELVPDAISQPDPRVDVTGTPEVEPGAAPESAIPSREMIMARNRQVTEYEKRATADLFAEKADEADAIAGKIDEAAGIQRKLGEDRRRLWANADAGYRKRWKDLDKLTEEIVKAKIEPKPLTGSTTGSRIASAIFLAMGALGGAMMSKRTGQPVRNLALETLYKAVEDDLNKQKAQLQTKHGSLKAKEGVLRHYWDHFRDKDTAMAKATADQLASVQSQIAAMAKRYEGQRQGELAQLAIAEIEKKRQALELQVDQAMRNDARADYKLETDRLAKLAKAVRGGKGGQPGGASEGKTSDWAGYFGWDMSKLEGQRQAKLLVPLDWSKKQYIIAVDDGAADELRTKHQAAKAVSRYAGALSHLIRTYGNEVNTTRYKTVIAAKMETLAVKLLNEMRKAEKLGALDEGSLRVAQQYLGNPSILRVNPNAVAEKLDLAMDIARDGWADAVGALALSGNYKGFWPEASYRIGDVDIGETKQEALDQAEHGATAEMRGQGAEKVADKAGAGSQKGFKGMIRRVVFSDAELDEAEANLKRLYAKEKDWDARNQIRTHLARVQEAKRQRAKGRELDMGPVAQAIRWGQENARQGRAD